MMRRLQAAPHHKKDAAAIGAKDLYLNLHFNDRR